VLHYRIPYQEAHMQEPREGTTRWRVLEFLEKDSEEASLNGIVLGVEGSAAAIRHAVESLLKSGHLKERIEPGPASTFTRKISVNHERAAS
jgi:hypothetical protein